MAKAPTGPTKPEAGVMATRPATAPEQMPTTVGLPLTAHSTSIQVNPATAVAICVTSMAMPACIPAVTAEPALKPNQPTHSSAAPDRKSTRLNSSHMSISYAVFCLKKKIKQASDIRREIITEAHDH